MPYSNYSYLSDGTKLQAVDGNGNGLVYSGSLVYNKQGGNLTLESAAVAGGRIIATNNGYKPQYFVTDHLGSVRAIVNDEKVAEIRNDYYPFGGRWNAGATSDNRYQFNGKESQAFVDVPYLDYGARSYDPLRGTWNGVDFLAEIYSSINPYVYCANNPICLIDPTGMAWFYYSVDGKSDPTWNWRDEDQYHTGVKDNDGNEVVLQGQDAVAVFDGSMDEKLGEGDNLYGEGAVLADVTVYGPNGADDVKQYKGYTMTANYKKFGAIADGEYNVSHVQAKAGAKIPKTHIINNGQPLDCINGVNPSPKEYSPYSPTQKNSIYIHRSNNNGWAGDKASTFSAVSTGCLLIVPHHWDAYNKQLGKVNYKLILKRR